MNIELLKNIDGPAWDTYVNSHPKATLYHLSGWRNVIEKVYYHDTYYIMATENNLQTEIHNVGSAAFNKAKIIGVLPLVHLKHFIFGNNLISMPFLDCGGILANNKKIEKALLSKAMALGQRLKVDTIELRHIDPLDSFYCNDSNWKFQTHSHKVSMGLQVPEDADSLMKSFKSKLRSQIKKPTKEGCISVISSVELLDNFYKVFSTNMRDLGSPVHSKKFFRQVLKEFQGARICMIFKKNQPIAASIIIGFKDMLINPWASSLRSFSRLSPNMLLYWTMLEYACKNHYQYFNFGRSSPGESTYKFKAQWGAAPTKLNWLYITTNGAVISADQKKKPVFKYATRLWQTIPVPFTRAFGPSIRKYIGL